MQEQNQFTSDLKDRVRVYWNSRSATFDQDIGHGADEKESALWKKHLGAIIGPAPKRVLDVGTGTGMIALNLAAVGHTVTGIDLGEKMLALARMKANMRQLPVTFKIGDAEEPDFPDETFDCVICRHLLWTLPHPDKAIQEWSRISKDGGIIIAIDGHATPHNYFPDEECTTERARLWREMYSKEVQEQLPLTRDPTVKNLASFLTKQNLADVKYCSFDEIAEYQKQQAELREEKSEECEVNVIWGVVRK